VRQFPCILLITLVVAACTAPPREDTAARPAPPAAAAAVAPAPGAEAWRVTAAQLEIRVFRDGPMQKLGHDHLITSAGLAGEI